MTDTPLGAGPHGEPRRVVIVDPTTGDPAGTGTTTGVVVNAGGAIGEVQATPTANTVLRRLKDILSLIVLAAGSNIIGKVGIDQTTPGTTNAVSVVGQVPVTATLVDNSITSATGSSQTLLAANAARKALTIINPLWETTAWTIGPTGAAAVAGAVPGITLNPGDEWTPHIVPLNAITGIGTSTHKLTVLEG